jgi:hypothetical protein
MLVGKLRLPLFLCGRLLGRPLGERESCKPWSLKRGRGGRFGFVARLPWPLVEGSEVSAGSEKVPTTGVDVLDALPLTVRSGFRSAVERGGGRGEDALLRSSWMSRLAPERLDVRSVAADLRWSPFMPLMGTSSSGRRFLSAFDSLLLPFAVSPVVLPFLFDVRDEGRCLILSTVFVEF